MDFKVLQGILIPLLGTSLGAACVFFLKGNLSEKVQKSLSGLAAGIMASASFFSLLKPSLEMAQDQDMGKLSFVPAVVGFLIGMLFLLFLDVIIPHMHVDNREEGPKNGLDSSTKLVLAVTLHNIPEGMAMGIVYAGWLYGHQSITMASALALAIGIAIQNFPEGAIVSMPLCAQGMSKPKTFALGVFSGVVEPIGALLTIYFAGFFLPIMPYLLSFAAGAMFYVIVEELIPEMKEGKHSNTGTIMFAIGFVIMMMLDVGLA